jgi:hypothetical protein
MKRFWQRWIPANGGSRDSKVYTYRFDGDINTLRVEDGESLGFEAINIDDLFTLTEEDKKKFTSSFGGEVINFYKRIKELSQL